jgi:very-short-patch-repair endonuclease
MSDKNALPGTSAVASLPSGEGRGGVRRVSAVRSAREALSRLPSYPPTEQPEAARPWGRPEATTSVEAARALRKRMTPQEAKIWLRLRSLRAQGFHFHRQVPINRFVVDFACLRERLIIEIDGGQHGFEANAFQDRTRDAALARAGFEVLRFWNADVDADPNAVIDTIFARLGEGRRS